jgi:hypothetical protein
LERGVLVKRKIFHASPLSRREPDRLLLAGVLGGAGGVSSAGGAASEVGPFFVVDFPKLDKGMLSAPQVNIAPKASYFIGRSAFGLKFHDGPT